MPSTERNSEIRELFKATKARFPQQVFEKETAEGLLEDWRDLCAEVGWRRFECAVKRARTYTQFFPSVKEIRQMVPSPNGDNAEHRREMRELEKRRAAGERFYTLGDALLELSRQVISGEVKGKTEASQKRLMAWAVKVQQSVKAYAAKMLQDNNDPKKREKSDFTRVGDS